MKQLNRDIVRLLDANMNRAVEGIRVLEEIARMLFDDSNLTNSIKGYRSLHRQPSGNPPL